MPLAVAYAGRGRVALFADSALLSSFDLFRFGRAELLLRLIVHLNHEAALRDVPPPALVQRRSPTSGRRP